MNLFLRRAIGKVTRECNRLCTISKILIHPVKLPDASEAKSHLEKLSADAGGSCWTDVGFEHKDRTLPLSVIIPAYNVEKYIDSCMESVLRQQVDFDYEVIVVNDGSVDGTASLLEKYKTDRRVCIIHQQNRGFSGARNTGIAFSKGEYLCFVDSDDELPDGALEALMSTAMKEHAKLVIGSYEKLLRNGTVQYTKRLPSEKVRKMALPGFAHGRIIHHSVFQNLRFPEGYWYEDSIMAQIVHPMCRDEAYTVSQICYRYYSNESGITATSLGNAKSLDSLWITIRLLNQRSCFGLVPTQDSYHHFLSMVRLTYRRTMFLGPDVAQSVFVVQRMLIDRYYPGYQTEDRTLQRIQKALRSNHFRAYVLACE